MPRSIVMWPPAKAIKILINSVYGAFGNQYFYFFNIDIAQSITLQGQDMIKFANKAINFYFKERWHLDTKLHKELGIDSYVVNKVKILGQFLQNMFQVSN